MAGDAYELVRSCGDSAFQPPVDAYLRFISCFVSERRRCGRCSPARVIGRRHRNFVFVWDAQSWSDWVVFARRE